MNWINIEVNLLDRPEMMAASNHQIGVWLRLMRYCCAQENKGILANACAFDDVMWLILARVDERYFETPCALWSWQNEDRDLVLWGYPEAKEAEVKNLKAMAAEAGKRSGESRRNRKANGTVQRDGSTGSETDPLNGIRKEVERERKEKGKEEEDAPARSEDFSEEESDLSTLAGATDALVSINDSWDTERVRVVISNALRICPRPDRRAVAVKDFLDELLVQETAPDVFPLARFKGFMRHAAEETSGPAPGESEVRRFGHGE